MAPPRLHAILWALVLCGAGTLLWSRRVVSAPLAPGRSTGTAHLKEAVRTTAEPIKGDLEVDLERSSALQPALEGRLDRIFESLRRRHREEVRTGGYSGGSTFEFLTRLYLREARLLARAFPQEIEPRATALTLDPRADDVDRLFAEYFLCWIAEKGNSSALGSLFLLTKEESLFSNVALAGIAAADSKGLYQELYREHFRRGSATAVEILSGWWDAGTAALMNECLNGSWGQRHHAKDVLNRFDILTSPTAEEQLSSFVEGNGKTKSRLDSSFEWALVVMRRRSPHKLFGPLRARLDRDFAGVCTSSALSGEALLNAFAETPDLTKQSQDPFYDEALIAQSEIGGELSDAEKARLRTFGYACDPKERLLELLGPEMK